MARQKKKTTKKQKPSDPFSKLTWEDLEEVPRAEEKNSVQ